MQRVNVEVPLAATLARNGEIELARALIASWAPPSSDYVPLDAGRDMARAECELLAGAWDEAERTARRSCVLFDSSDMLLYACHARFLIALAAPPSRFAAALDHYRRTVQRARMPVHRARLQLLERLAARGMRSVREQTTQLRSRFESRTVSIAESLIPRASVLAADIYWDRIQHALWVGGKGPLSLDEHPVLERMLEQIVDAREYTLSLDALFERVWHAPYHPLVHENKLHVTIHRLRGWLDEHSPGLGRAIVVRDGAISIAEHTSVIVLDEPPALAADRRPYRERLLDCLAAAPQSAQELERRLGISRTTLHGVTRELIAEGAIECSGRGRALRYSRR
jgi:hypothetical protein